MPYWWRVQWLYVVYRCTLSFYFLVWLVYNISTAHSNGSTEKHFSFLTNWSFLVWNIYLFVSAISVSINQLRRHQCCLRKNTHSRPTINHCCCTCICSHDKTTVCDKLSWLLFTISSELAVAVTILYWSLQSTGDTFPSDPGANVHVHLVNGCVAVLDVWIAGFPIHIFHFLYTFLFMSSYAVFNQVQYATNNTITLKEKSYPIFDYGSKHGLAVGVVFGISFGLLPLVHAIFIFQYLCRNWITTQLHKRLQAYRKHLSSAVLMEHSDTLEDGEADSSRVTFSTAVEEQFDV